MRVPRSYLRVLGTGVIGLAPLVGQTQVVLPANQDKPTLNQNEIGGKLSFEHMKASTERPSLPLRYGHVKVGSEIVETEGRTLVRDKDYMMDYVSGVVFLKFAFRDGQAVSVQYRYDEATGAQGTFGLGTNSTKFQGYTFHLNQNTSMILGMGLTERLGDGTVLSSNVYGLQNSFKLGSGTIKGLYMVGDRKKVATDNLFGEKTAASNPIEEGKSQAILQQMNFGFLGGKTSLTYQDIGDKFGGFSAFESSGYDQAQISQFANEKGLKRTDIRTEGLGGKGLGLSAGVKSIGDDMGAITWRNYAATLMGIGFNYSSSKVDPGFSRFNSIAEGDRAQLAKERGLDRQAISAGKTFKGGAFKFDTTKVETLEGFGLYRRSANLDLPWLKAAFGDQHVQAGFNRFGDLREGDRDQLAREGGLSRESNSVTLAPKGGPSLSWSSAVVRTDTGDFTARDMGLSMGPFSIQHGRREVAPGFGALGSLSQPEIGAHLNSMVKMTDPNAGVQGQDMGGWGNSAGLNRSNWRLGYDMGKGSNFSAATQSIRGALDELNVQQFSLATPQASASFRTQVAGKDFTEGTRLLFTEQQRLGTAAGLTKTDMNFAAGLGGLKKIGYSRMVADDQTGGLIRQAFSFTDKGFNLNYNRRAVDSTFASLPGMVDPERDLLMGMMGFDQSEISGGWQLYKNLSLQYQDSKAINTVSGLGRFGSMTAFKWNVDKLTEITGSNFEAKQTDPNQPLVDQQVQRFQIDRNLGKLGKLSLMEQKTTYDGSLDTNPDAKTQTVIYENQLTKSTSIRTEHSKTQYETGEHETKTSNSIAQALNSRIGVSVTDTKVEREGDQPDEVHRDYGFWVDFGKNIRLNYKALRNMKGETEGDLHNEVSVSPGQVQGVNVGSASYQRNGWDDQRDQHIGNVSLSNVAPMRWGFLQDVRFNYSVDSVRDMDAWQREYRTMGFGARIGAFAFGVDYKSQSLPAGDRAIDRIFAFTTDVTGKGKLRADVKYNLRTLPYGQQVMARNYTITAEPIKHWEVSHSVLTNPLQADGNAMLGAVATPMRSNKWGVGFDGNPRTKFNFGYEEVYNEQTNQQTTALKLGATLFANNPSPLVLEYVMAESNASGEMQRSHGFNLAFNQRPGPNQSLSFKLSNLNWELARPIDQGLQNWNLRLDYSWKF